MNRWFLLDFLFYYFDFYYWLLNNFNFFSKKWLYFLYYLFKSSNITSNTPPDVVFGNISMFETDLIQEHKKRVAISEKRDCLLFESYDFAILCPFACWYASNYGLIFATKHIWPFTIFLVLCRIYNRAVLTILTKVCIQFESIWF